MSYTRLAYYRGWIEASINNPAMFEMSDKHTRAGVNTYDCDRHSVPCGCGRVPVQFVESRIINGEEAIPYSWSMVVSIRVNGSDTHACGGSILNGSYILTSAQCIAYAPIFGISIAAGMHDHSDSSALIRKVDGVYIHPNYTGATNQHANDITILHLSEPLDLDNDGRISRTCFPQLFSAAPNPIYFPFAEALLAVIGWGYTEYQNSSIPHVLHQAEVVSANLSDKHCHVLDMEHDRQFCTDMGQIKKGCHSCSLEK
jgi:hypothetical protein